MGRRVLIVGKSSYIGRKLEQYIVSHSSEDEIQVDKISVRNDEWKKIDFGIYDSIVFLSALVHEHGKGKSAKQFKQINSKLPYEFAKKAKKDGCSHFIFFSSISIYGKECGVITKDIKPSPTTYYGKSKWLAEKYLKTLEDNQFYLAILRPPMVYGEQCKGNYSKLEKWVKYLPIFPKFDNKRSMVSIQYLSQFVFECIQNKTFGIFFPQDSHYHCTSQFVKQIGENQGKNVYLISGFQGSITFLQRQQGKIGKIANKIFGDLYIIK